MFNVANNLCENFHVFNIHCLTEQWNFIVTKTCKLPYTIYVTRFEKSQLPRTQHQDTLFTIKR